MAIRQRKRVTRTPDERRADILAAAVKVFASKGVSNATVSDIASAAGVAKGTFYLYFESKEALLAALKERFVDDMVSRALAMHERVGVEDWWAIVDDTVDTFVDYTLENRDMIQVIAQDMVTPGTSSILVECERKMDEIFAAGIRAGVEAGAYRTEDPGTTASLLRHAIHGLLERAILFDTKVERKRIVAAAKQLCRKALAP